MTDDDDDDDDEDDIQYLCGDDTVCDQWSMICVNNNKKGFAVAQKNKDWCLLCTVL